MQQIAFIDLEASGLSARSWPIEVGWCVGAGAPQAFLVKPQADWSLDDWSADAEVLHGLAHGDLVKEGADPADICAALNAALAGCMVYSDAPDWDGFWLYRLFQAARARQEFILHDLGRVLHAASPEQLRRAVAAADAVAPRRHRAADDVLHLRALYQAIAA